MGKEESTGPVELKDDDSKKEEIVDRTNTEVRYEKAVLCFLIPTVYSCSCPHPRNNHSPSGVGVGEGCYIYRLFHLKTS